MASFDRNLKHTGLDRMANVEQYLTDNPITAGTGTVSSVSSADTSIAVTNPTTTPALQLATLDVIAANEKPVAAVALNSQKITGLANGSVSSDAAAFGQIPTSLPPNGAAGGDMSGTYPNPTYNYAHQQPFAHAAAVGLKTQSADRRGVGALTESLTSGRCYAIMLDVYPGMVMTNGVVIVGTVNTSTYFGIGLYSLDGQTQYATTGDVHASLTTNVNSFAFASPYTVGAGIYALYGVVLGTTSGTNTTIYRLPALGSGGAPALAIGAGALPVAQSGSGQTQLPASFTPAGAANTNPIWIGVS